MRERHDLQASAPPRDRARAACAPDGSAGREDQREGLCHWRAAVPPVGPPSPTGADSPSAARSRPVIGYLVEQAPATTSLSLNRLRTVHPSVRAFADLGHEQASVPVDRSAPMSSLGRGAYSSRRGDKAEWRWCSGRGPRSPSLRQREHRWARHNAPAYVPGTCGAQRSRDRAPRRAVIRIGATGVRGADPRARPPRPRPESAPLPARAKRTRTVDDPPPPGARIHPCHPRLLATRSLALGKRVAPIPECGLY